MTHDSTQWELCARGASSLELIHGRNLGERQVDEELEVVRNLGRSFIERCTPKHGHNNGQDHLLVHQREVSEEPLESRAVELIVEILCDRGANR